MVLEGSDGPFLVRDVHESDVLVCAVYFFYQKKYVLPHGRDDAIPDDTPYR